MTDTTPAAVLRAAAKLLRDDAHRAERVSPLPWQTTDEHVIRCGNDERAIVADRSSEPGEAGDLPYIALMHPGVGLALADWLDAAAKSYDATVIGAASVWRRSDEAEERDAWVAKQTDQNALAVARQINGTAP